MAQLDTCFCLGQHSILLLICHLPGLQPTLIIIKHALLWLDPQLLHLLHFNDVGNPLNIYQHGMLQVRLGVLSIWFANCIAICIALLAREMNKAPIKTWEFVYLSDMALCLIRVALLMLAIHFPSPSSSVIIPDDLLSWRCP